MKEKKGKDAKRPAQWKRVLNYMLLHGSITRYTSVFELGIFELSTRIVLLESMGYNITHSTHVGEDKEGYMFHYTRYTLGKRGKNDNI